jgi:hypothetical protein
MAKETDTTEKKQTKEHLFKSGEAWSGNRAGRPKGSRNKLSESFIQALSDDFEKNGVQVIETVRTEKPSDYLKIIAAIVPKELNVRDMSLEDMSDEELLDSLDTVRALAANLLGASSQGGNAKARGKKAPGTAH